MEKKKCRKGPYRLLCGEGVMERIKSCTGGLKGHYHNISIITNTHNTKACMSMTNQFYFEVIDFHWKIIQYPASYFYGREPIPPLKILITIDLLNKCILQSDHLFLTPQNTSGWQTRCRAPALNLQAFARHWQSVHARTGVLLPLLSSALSQAHKQTNRQNIISARHIGQVFLIVQMLMNEKTHIGQ